MIEIFHLIFGICLVVNVAKTGDGLIMLAKIITLINSIHDKSPKLARKRGNHMAVEYKQGNKIYCILVPIREGLDWTHAAVYKNGVDEPLEKTAKIRHFAGPMGSFHSSPLRPMDISAKYSKIAFRFRDNAVIHVNADQVIVSILRAERNKQQALKITNSAI